MTPRRFVNLPVKLSIYVTSIMTSSCQQTYRQCSLTVHDINVYLLRAKLCTQLRRESLETG